MQDHVTIQVFAKKSGGKPLLWYIYFESVCKTHAEATYDGAETTPSKRFAEITQIIILDSTNVAQELLNTIVTNRESRIYRYDPETKMYLL